MATPQIVIFDALTGETITRDMTKTELTEHEALQAQAKKNDATKAKAEQVAINNRQQILDRLGITHDELLTILP